MFCCKSFTLVISDPVDECQYTLLYTSGKMSASQRSNIVKHCVLCVTSAFIAYAEVVSILLFTLKGGWHASVSGMSQSEVDAMCIFIVILIAKMFY